MSRFSRYGYFLSILVLTLTFFAHGVYATPVSCYDGGTTCTDNPPMINGVADFDNPNDPQTVTLSGSANGGSLVPLCRIDGPFYDAIVYTLSGFTADILNTDLGGEPIPTAVRPYGYAGQCSDYQDWTYTWNVTINISGLTAGNYTAHIRAINSNNVEATVDIPFTVNRPITTTYSATMRVATVGAPGSWVLSGGFGNFSGSGTSGGPYTITSTSTSNFGNYTISNYDQTCYSASVLPSTVQSFQAGDEKTFTITYTYTCGGGGTAPTVNLKFNNSDGPVTVNSGDSGTLSWNMGGGAADTCTAGSTANDWSGNKSTTGGNEGVSNITSSRTYSISCDNAYGSGSDTVDITVNGQPPPPNNPPSGAVDPSNCTMNGWAYDSETPNTAVTVRVYKDGNSNQVDSFQASNFRQDLYNIGFGNGNHGFTRAAPSSLQDGTHTLNFYAVDTTTGAEASNAFGSYTYNFSSCVDHAPSGALDAPAPGATTCTRIAGWAYDQDTVNTAVRVDFYRGAPVGQPGSVGLTSVNADVFRQDLYNIGFGNGYHGYDFNGPDPLSLGIGNSYTFYAYAINTANNGNNTYISSGNVVCTYPAPTVSVSASPNPVIYSTASTLTWSSTDTIANSCSITGGGVSGSSTGLSTSGSKSTVNLTTATTYTVTCQGLNGSPASNQVTVNVGGAPVMNYFRCNGVNTDGTCNVDYGGTATITWSSSNTTGCSLVSTAPSDDYVAPSGSRNDTGIVANRTYNIECWNDVSGVHAPALPLPLHVVINGPSVDMKANNSNGPITLNWNSSANLSWTSSSAGSCTKSGDWSGSATPNIPGSQSTGSLTNPKTYNYTLGCSGNGSSSDTVQVILNQPVPNTPTNVTITEPDYCQSGPAATVSWTYSDPSGSPQSAYQVQITSTGNFNNPIWDTGKLNSGSSSYFTGQGVLEFNTTYKARVKTWNSYDVVSDWSNPSSSWKTPSYAYPQVDFYWTANGIQNNPSPPLDKPVSFTDMTVFNGNPNGRDWDWIFGDGGTSTSQNPSHTYTAEGSYYMMLTATDNANQSCSRTKGPIIIQQPIPKIREVAPK